MQRWCPVYLEQLSLKFYLIFNILMLRRRSNVLTLTRTLTSWHINHFDAMRVEDRVVRRISALITTDIFRWLNLIAFPSNSTSPGRYSDRTASKLPRTDQLHNGFFRHHRKFHHKIRQIRNNEKTAKTPKMWLTRVLPYVRPTSWTAANVIRMSRIYFCNKTSQPWFLPHDAVAMTIFCLSVRCTRRLESANFLTT